MTFTLTINAQQFRTHLANVLAQNSDAGADVIPVIKGNGYGFGRSLLAGEVTSLGLEQVCVGTIWEAEELLEGFSGTVIVLEPILGADQFALLEWKKLLTTHADRLVAVIAGTDIGQLKEFGLKQVWLEVRTSMNRFGLTVSQIATLTKQFENQISIAGFSLHLPIAQSNLSSLVKFETQSVNTDSNKVREVLGLISWLREVAEIDSGPLSVMISHLSPSEVAAVRRECPDVQLRIRLGTSLWLGAEKALTVTGTVLAIHHLSSTDKAGYQQNSGGKQVAVVSGGTAHGVALAAPIPATNLRKRGIAIVEGIAQAVGKVRSPFSLNGQNLNFVEPPHMQVSMLWADNLGLKVGDQINCNVRNTTASFDAVIWE